MKSKNPQPFVADPFARRLARLRRAKKITVTQAAEWLAVSRRTYSGWEYGQHKPFPYLEKIMLKELAAEELRLQLPPLPNHQTPTTCSP